MSADADSSEMLASFNISELSEQELRHFLKIAQVEFQMGRLLGGGEIRAMGISNILQVLRLSTTRAKSSKDFIKFLGRIISNTFLWARARLRGGR